MSTFDLDEALKKVEAMRSQSSGCEGHDKSNSNVSKKKVMGGRDPEGITKTSSGYRIVKFQWICDDCGEMVDEEDIRGGKR